MAARGELVFDVIAEPYRGRTPRALADKLRVLEAGSDMVLAAHFTPLGGRLGLAAQTVETVRFTRPERVDCRLVRGPVPHVVEAFVLTEQPTGGTLLAYQGKGDLHSTPTLPPPPTAPSSRPVAPPPAALPAHRHRQAPLHPSARRVTRRQRG
jgi:hypothetical protein